MSALIEYRFDLPNNTSTSLNNFFTGIQSDVSAELGDNDSGKLDISISPDRALVCLLKPFQQSNKPIYQVHACFP